MDASKKNKLYRILFIVGILFFYVGILDPLEGSVVISCGIILMTLASYLRKDPKSYLFLIAMISVIIGVIALFVVSSFGGLGKDALSPWWGLTFLPYPLGWIFGTLVLLLKYWKNKVILKIIGYKTRISHRFYFFSFWLYELFTTNRFTHFFIHQSWIRSRNNPFDNQFYSSI